MLKLNKILPWILGSIGGALIALLAVVVLQITSADDPKFKLVAVSWGARSDGDGPWIYQVQVISDDVNGDGILEVSAKACIGSSDYFHDFGNIGTAQNKKEAVDKFGKITWTKDRVSIGGLDGEKASIERKLLEKHR